jgi:L-ribulose-5-phosphate 4-epimerase
MVNFQNEKQQVVETCLKLVGKGFLMGTGGNVSVRVAGQPAFAITPTNYDYTLMTPEDVCVLDWQLKPLAGERKPSIESGLHAAIYANRPDACAVIHTHQVYASAFALMNQPIPALFDEQARFLGRSVEIVSYAPSGTGMLKRSLASRLRNHSTPISCKTTAPSAWANHPTGQYLM